LAVQVSVGSLADDDVGLSDDKLTSPTIVSHPTLAKAGVRSDDTYAHAKASARAEVKPSRIRKSARGSGWFDSGVTPDPDAEVDFLAIATGTTVTIDFIGGGAAPSTAEVDFVIPATLAVSPLDYIHEIFPVPNIHLDDVTDPKSTNPMVSPDAPDAVANLNFVSQSIHTTPSANLQLPTLQLTVDGSFDVGAGMTRVFSHASTLDSTGALNQSTPLFVPSPIAGTFFVDSPVRVTVSVPVGVPIDLSHTIQLEFLSGPLDAPAMPLALDAIVGGQLLVDWVLVEPSEFRFTPEPSSGLLAVVGLGFLIARRRS